MLLVNVRFRSLTGKRLQLYALYDPSLGNDAMDDSGDRAGKALSRVTRAARCRARWSVHRLPADLERLPGRAKRRPGGPEGLPHGREVRGGAERQRRADGRTRLTGVGGRPQLTVALGFGGQGPR